MEVHFVFLVEDRSKMSGRREPRAPDVQSQVPFYARSLDRVHLAAQVVYFFSLREA